MERLIRKYAGKLVSAGLASPQDVIFGGLDVEIVWNREDPRIPVLETLFQALNINSLLFSKPAEPYRTIVDYLASQEDDLVRPSDCETRTFLHDIPVIDNLSSSALIKALESRKGVIVRGGGIAALGSVTPEQAFVTFSSVCFACFVKFFGDYLAAHKRGRVDALRKQAFETALRALPAPAGPCPELTRGPFQTEEEVLRAMCEAGRWTVKLGLVDSYFGNISYLLDNTLYISQTGSSLDELEGYIDPCPLDDSSCAGITASSELSAHVGIVEHTGAEAVLHGHPKFAVILSMDCDKHHCTLRGECHVKCEEPRYIGDIPVVPGEVGTGPFGLCRTLPPAVKGHRGGVVYGHGLFTIGVSDFNVALKSLLDVENMSRVEYFRRVGCV